MFFSLSLTYAWDDHDEERSGEVTVWGEDINIKVQGIRLLILPRGWEYKSVILDGRLVSEPRETVSSV